MRKGKMIFVVGNSRSGTTMMARMLGMHSEIHMFNELHFFDGLVSAQSFGAEESLHEDRCLTLLERLFTTSRKGLFQPVLAGEFVNEAREVMRVAGERTSKALFQTFLQVESSHHGKSGCCEQTPRNVFFLDLILSAYPNARVINMVRDPRDILLSQKNKWRRGRLGGGKIPRRELIRSWFNYDPIITSRIWASAVRQAQAFREHPRMVSVRFEDVLTEPETTIRELCRRIDLSFEPGMLNVPAVGSSLDADDAAKLGVDASRLGKWRRGGLRRYELKACEWIGRREMSLFGYEVGQHGGLYLPILSALILTAVKSPFILIFNFDRITSLRESLVRYFKANGGR
jgi:omega-hydroxy-beta-dihydromenaquinone-9 sulfotransferase